MSQEPRTGPPGCSSRRVEQKKRREWRAECLLGSAVSALQQLAFGGTREALTGAQSAPVEADRDRLLVRCKSFVDRYGEVYSGSTGFGRDEAALERLLKQPQGAYGNAGRGTVVPAVVDKIALPDCSDKFHVAERLPEFKEWGSKVLGDEEEMAARGKRAAEIPSHCDPALHPGSIGLLELAVRLYKAGLVVPVKKRAPFGVRVFTVLKSGDIQRLIFDMCRVNACFRKPEGCTLGSGAALASLDLSDAAIGSDACAASAGDLPNFFYTLSLGQAFAELVWLDGVEVGPFVDRLRQEALISAQEAEEWRASCDAIGFQCLPMGWSWAPVIAQHVLEWLLEQAGEEAESRLRHGEGSAPLTRDRGANMGYLDDFTLIARGEDPQTAVDQAGQRLGRVRSTLREEGLGCHKEQVGQIVVSLGFVLDLVAKECRPEPEKFCRLLRGTRALLRRKRVKPRWISSIAGHWAWLFTLNPGFFSLFQHLYFFLQEHKTPSDPRGAYAGWDELVEVPEAVMQELRWALKLAPLLVANLGAPVSQVVTCTDASTWGGASTHATKPRAEVTELVRAAASWDGALQAPEPEFFMGSDWRLGFRSEWSESVRAKHINALEARTVEVAVRRLVRNSQNRDMRPLMFLDNQAALGALRKGRSSSWGLLVPCRRIFANCLFAGLRPVFRFVPTDRNCSDLPSRGGHTPGVASARGVQVKPRAVSPPSKAPTARPPEVARETGGSGGCAVPAMRASVCAPLLAAAASGLRPDPEPRGFGGASTWLRAELRAPLEGRSALVLRPAPRVAQGALAPVGTIVSGASTWRRAERAVVGTPRAAVASGPRPDPGPRGFGGASTWQRAELRAPLEGRSVPGERAASNRAAAGTAGVGVSRASTWRTASGVGERVGAAQPLHAEPRSFGRTAPATAAGYAAAGTQSRRWRPGDTDWAWWSIPALGCSPLELVETARHKIGLSSRRSYAEGYMYLKDFLGGALRGSAAPLPGDIDAAVAKFVDFVLYQGFDDGCSYKARANHAFFALLYAYPALTGHLPVSANALKGFARLRPSVEGEPLPLGVCGVIACEELRLSVLAGNRMDGESFATELMVAFDSLHRYSEHSGLRRQHVAQAGDRGLALLLGVDRPTKTGRREGTVVETPFVKQLLAEYYRSTATRSDDAWLFDSSGAFAGRLATAAQRLGLPHVWPHLLRHSGATHFAQVMKWPAKDVMLRGRWQSVKSVQRYCKPHVLVQAWAALPTPLQLLARAFEADPARMLARARAGLPLQESGSGGARASE